MILRLAALLVLALLVPAASARADTAADTLRVLNQARAEHGLQPLRADAQLAQAARGHSRDMVANGYFAHAARAGDTIRSRVARTGWLRNRSEWWLGEILAWGTGALATPDAAVAAWLASPAHRQIMLARNPRAVGIGVAVGTPGHGPGFTYTADFGS